METYEQWLKREAAFAESLWKDFTASGLSKTDPEHAHFMEAVEKKIAAWRKANPPPSALPKAPPPPPPGFVSTEKKLAELAEESRMAEAARLAQGERMLNQMRRARRMGQGMEGVTNLSTILGVVGTAGVGTAVAATGKALFKLWVEDKILSAGIQGMEKTISVYEEATMPSTVAEAEAMYKSYVASCDRVVPSKGGPVHIRSEVMPKEKWLAMTYGVRWDALTK